MYYESKESSPVFKFHFLTNINACYSNCIFHNFFICKHCFSNCEFHCFSNGKFHCFSNRKFHKLKRKKHQCLWPVVTLQIVLVPYTDVF